MATALTPDTLKRLADAGLDPPVCPGTSPSSWTATAAGPGSAACERVEGHLPRRAERPHHHRGMLPARHRAADALLLQHRELETSAGRARFSHDAAAEVPALPSVKRSWSRTSASPSSANAKGSPPRCCEEMDENIRVSRQQHRHGPVPGHQLQRPLGDGRDDARAGPASAERQAGPGRHRRDDRSATPCSPPACPTRICSSARPARCASAISCSGRSPTLSCG